MLGNWYGATRQIRSRGNSSLPTCSRLGAAYRSSVPSSATRASWVGRRPPPPPPPRSNLRRMGKEEGKLARFSLPPPHQPSSLIVSRNDLLLRTRSGEEKYSLLLRMPRTTIVYPRGMKRATFQFSLFFSLFFFLAFPHSQNSTGGGEGEEREAAENPLFPPLPPTGLHLAGF